MTMTPERVAELIARFVERGPENDIFLNERDHSDTIAALQRLKELEAMRPLLNGLCSLQEGHTAQLSLGTEKEMSTLLEFLMDSGAREHKCGAQRG